MDPDMADPLNQDQARKLEALIAKHGLSDYARKIRKAARPCVDITVGKAVKRPGPGTSRIGGLPDLPPNLDYPQEDNLYFLFVGQINLGEIGFPSSLPPSGMLYFFVQDVEMASDVMHAVHFHDGDSTGLQRAALPRDAEFYEEDSRLVKPYALIFAPGISLPDYYDEWTEENLKEDEDSDALDRYLNFLGAVSEARPGGQMLGYPRLANPDESPEGSVLLLEIASHGEMQWWDAGALQFFVTKRDLVKKRFGDTSAQIYTS
jgi:uncharacterized protein YwqG